MLKDRCVSIRLKFFVDLSVPSSQISLTWSKLQLFSCPLTRFKQFEPLKDLSPSQSLDFKQTKSLKYTFLLSLHSLHISSWIQEELGTKFGCVSHPFGTPKALVIWLQFMVVDLSRSKLTESPSAVGGCNCKSFYGEKKGFLRV